MNNSWSAADVAANAGGKIVAGNSAASAPAAITIDSRAIEPGALFVGLTGSVHDGGEFAAAALASGAWGVIVSEQHAAALDCDDEQVVIAVSDPLRALADLAHAWRRELACAVIAVTGSTGKTSTKDIIAGMLAPSRRTVATIENFNTEIGLPLTSLAELTRIAQPDVGVIVNVGPVHLELLGTVEAVARAKAELLVGLGPDAIAVVPADEALLEPHIRSDIRTVRFGPGGELEQLPETIELPFASAHMRSNALAALAAVRALGVEPSGLIEVELSKLRGQRLLLEDNVVVINDCYNANPMSMRAALDDLADSASGRTVAVLGDMRELGPDQRRFHAELGAHVRELGVEVLVTVGELARDAGPPFGGENLYSLESAAQAADQIASIVEPGDTVLIKGSRGVGLEVVGESLCQALPPAAGGGA